MNTATLVCLIIFAITYIMIFSMEKIRPYATLQDGLEQRIKNIR